MRDTLVSRVMIILNIIVTANSPGEIYGWVRPLIKRLKKDKCRITLIFLPCAFSTGKEREVSLNILDIDEVVSVREILKFLFLGSKVKAFSLYPPDLIVHLGGDLFYGALIAKRLNIRAVAYKWAHKKWDGYFSKYFVPHEKFKDKILRQGISEKKVDITGELVADAVFDELEMTGPLNIPDKPVICFMAGNRLREVKGLIPFFIRIAELVEKNIKSSSFIFSISSFISEREIIEVIRGPGQKGFAASRAELIRKDGKVYLESENGTEILLYSGGGARAISSCDLLVTIPGTKTLEAAVVGKPSLVILPFNRPDLAPFHGIVGLLDYLPFLGPFIKGRILLYAVKKMTFLALPNILANREIVPEIKDILTPEMVADNIIKLVENKDLLYNMEKDLKDLTSSMRGAADRAAELIKSVVGNE